MVAVLQLAHVNVAIGIALLSLFVNLTAGEFVRILLVGLAGMFAYNLVYARVATGLLSPVRAWLEGKRDREATLAAWKACASFPREMMRRDWSGRLQGVLG